MRLWAITFLFGAVSATQPSWAQEHYACANPTLGAAVEDAAQLRYVATICSNPSVRELYYNRAAHRDLLSEALVLDGLIRFGASDDSDTLLSYQTYIALVEALAPVWFPELEDRVSFLNAEYERRSEIARLRLRGYVPLANRLEHQRRALNSPTPVE